METGYKRLKVEKEKLKKKARDEQRTRRTPEYMEIAKQMDTIERSVDDEEVRAFKALDDEVKRQREVGITAFTARSDLRAMRFLYIAAVKASANYDSVFEYPVDDDFREHAHVLRHMADLVALADF